MFQAVCHAVLLLSFVRSHLALETEQSCAEDQISLIQAQSVIKNGIQRSKASDDSTFEVAGLNVGDWVVVLKTFHTAEKHPAAVGQYFKIRDVTDSRSSALERNVRLYYLQGCDGRFEKNDLQKVRDMTTAGEHVQEAVQHSVEDGPTPFSRGRRGWNEQDQEEEARIQHELEQFDMPRNRFHSTDAGHYAARDELRRELELQNQAKKMGGVVVGDRIYPSYTGYRRL